MTFMEFLPMLVYILLIILLIILIIIGIKVIIIVDKTDKLIEDVQEKISAFNSIFSLINLTSEKINFGINTIIDKVVCIIKKLFKKRKEDNEYE